jgi:hypothetical protein
MTSWELIFLHSRVNNSGYDGDDLPAQKWDWPRGTWFQKRLHHLREKPANSRGVSSTGPTALTEHKAHKLNHDRLRPRGRHVEPAYNSRAPMEESIDTPTRLLHVSNNLLSPLEMQSVAFFEPAEA